MRNLAGSIDPERLTPTASLNRVQIVALPGVAVEPDVLGQTAYWLLRAQALMDLVRERADRLGLRDVRDAEPGILLPRFDRCLVDGDGTVREAAEAVARRFGQRLGFLILTLRRGDAANRRARPDWAESYWAHWAAIRTIRVAGGIVSGNFGPRLVEHATRTLADAGMADCDVRLASWPALLPLVGAARTAGPTSEAAVVFDFGHSFVKRGIGRYDGGRLTQLEVFPHLPAEGAAPLGDAEPTPEHAQHLGEFMANVMADAWRVARALGRSAGTTLVASIASYVWDGQPLPRQGGAYAAPLSLSENMARWLSDRVSDRLGQTITVTLLHDGTSAARAYAGEPRAAVIMMGTALGVGFPPPVGSLRPLAPTFAIREPTSAAE
ncbi:MAG: hypothetical protein M3O34_05040 [Chloroflexota bacterium]|nr:hypothetical protein [Chloroflexota bacterium]